MSPELQRANSLDVHPFLPRPPASVLTRKQAWSTELSEFAEAPRDWSTTGFTSRASGPLAVKVTSGAVGKGRPDARIWVGMTSCLATCGRIVHTSSGGVCSATPWRAKAQRWEWPDAPHIRTWQVVYGWENRAQMQLTNALVPTPGAWTGGRLRDRADGQKG